MNRIEKILKKVGISIYDKDNGEMRTFKDVLNDIVFNEKWDEIKEMLKNER